ncbi:MAG: hypothetical protein FWF92_05535 [Oscillospiraceae bacterium]|nr:hypothetical protein [Oscillospiraceae bacterium]
MKKIVSVFLAAVIIISVFSMFAACGGGGGLSGTWEREYGREINGKTYKDSIKFSGKSFTKTQYTNLSESKLLNEDKYYDEIKFIGEYNGHKYYSIVRKGKYSVSNAGLGYKQIEFVYSNGDIATDYFNLTENTLTFTYNDIKYIKK